MTRKRNQSWRAARPFPIVGAIGVALSLASATLGQVSVPPGYYIQQITDGPWEDDPPRINNAGQIVFSRRSGPGNTGELFLWEKATGELTQLTDNDYVDAYPDIADDGTIVWSSGVGPPNSSGFPTFEILMRRPDGTVIQLTDNTEHDEAPRINDLGHVVWTGQMGPGCGGATMDVFFYDGSKIIAITRDGVPDGLANQGAAINDRDQIVWTKFDFCPNPWVSEIWMWDQGVSQKLTGNQVGPTGTSINSSGLVAWFVRRPANHAVELWQNGVTWDLTDWGTGPHLNEPGDVAFYRWHEVSSTWQQWLYLRGQFWQLSNDTFWNRDGDINGLGEVAWRSGPTTSSDVRLLRRYDLGDLNCDGSIDAFDIEPFISAVLEPHTYRSRYPWCDMLLADLNEDGVVDAFDIEPFVQVLVP